MSVEASQAGGRLDLFLAARLTPARTRSQIARMIRSGLVTVNQMPARPATLVREGDRVEISAPATAEVPAPAERTLAVQFGELFADDEIIVVNKPAGLTVHPAPSTREPTLAEALVARYPELAAMVEPDGTVRPGIVHRLDKDTSGVMVIARTPYSRAALSDQFKEREVDKVYLALVAGGVSHDIGTIALPVGRHRVDRKRMSVRSARPREAVTDFRVLARFEVAARGHEPAYVTLLRVAPKTGRTHQIRVHLAAMGHPCLGDPVYGVRGHTKPFAQNAFKRQALHALSLSFEHPRSRSRMRFVAPLPDDFAGFLISHGFRVDQSLLERWANAGK